MTALRDTFAVIDGPEGLNYRLAAAGALLGVKDNTLRTYADSAGITIQRDMRPGAVRARIFQPSVLFEMAQWRRAQGYIKGPAPGARPIFITVDVFKGGTGKTTTAVELAIHLALMGCRVLLEDLDSQASATQMMGYEADLEDEEAAAYGVNGNAIVTATLATVLTPYVISRSHSHQSAPLNISPDAVSDLIKRPFGSFGPHLLPADTFLADIEQSLANAKGHRELYLRQMHTEALEGKIPGLNLANYDVVIMDCPPSVSYTITAALAAADIVVAPTRLDAFSIKGLGKLMGQLKDLKAIYALDPELVILPTHYRPNLERIGRMQTEINKYRNLLPPGVISATEEFSKSLDTYLPLSLQKPTSNSAKEYRMFAEFIHGKIMQHAAAVGRP